MGAVREPDRWRVRFLQFSLVFVCAALAVLPSTVEAGSQTFNYTGGDQYFTVPSGVTTISVQLWGAGGGSPSGASGGAGGYTSGALSVSAGQTYTIIVGSGGTAHVSTGWPYGGSPATYGGGGSSYSTGPDVASGGGRSAIRLSGTELMTAGGGGGGFYFESVTCAWMNEGSQCGGWNPPFILTGHGGAGGGSSGQTGIPSHPTLDGTQGTGGTRSSPGYYEPDSSKGRGGQFYGGGSLQSGGGGGWYGGGAGQGAGGGSGHCGVGNCSTTTGGGSAQNQHGRAVITWTVNPAPTCSVSVSPSSYDAPGSATLSWSSAGADWFYITNVGYVPANGSTTVAPSYSATYSGTVSGLGGTNNCGATLTVHPYCTFNGATVTHGSSVTAYQSPSVTYGNTCDSQTRTCTDGTLSGSYQYASCTVGTPASCTLNGVTVPHGGSRTFYSVQNAPSGQVCSAYAQSRTCTNGSLSGSSSYQYASCSCAPSHYCSSNTITYRNSSCADVAVTTCISPAHCSNGLAACLYPSPSFNPTGDLSGHLQVRPLLVRSGFSARAYWNVSNVESCTVSGDNGDAWTGASSGSSGKTTSALTHRTTFTLACTGLDSSTLNESAVVNMVPVFNEQ